MAWQSGKVGSGEHPAETGHRGAKPIPDPRASGSLTPDTYSLPFNTLAIPASTKGAMTA